MKIAVCVHLYHIDMLDEIRLYLNNIQREYDLYVSLTKNYPQSFLNNIKKTK
jgi:lipopolysaccharide biosynthesis protein